MTDPPARLSRHTARPTLWRAVCALMLREMATSHGRVPGGYLWAVAEPLFGIALLSAIFAIGFQAPSLGTSFPLFYATGLLPFLAFSDITNKLAQALTFSRPLFAYPAVGVMDAILARFLLAAGTQIAVAALLLGGILFLSETRATPDIATLAQAAGCLMVLSLGTGMLNCLLIGLLPLWQRIWAIAMRPMFLISGVFFVFEAVPLPWRDLLGWNPLIHIVGLVRRGLYPGYDAGYVSVPYVLALGLGAALLAGIGLLRWHRDILSDL
ncbi:ABC transporter permease [Marivita hallyeonensis]|uniref:Capsular polysaccharide transport system permease protein n=1 Tax=Marivita hallyeonensis TaxID=996342 RepID=A0A1M5Y7S4_9RHOB|nr:ABC transporter permease [Marivita hallyeonensis]SHI07523.1 capsular polysaccharide transport system permease protein [Marivita hallyeonensis]